MLAVYLDKAMQRAQYEPIEDGTIFATIPGFVWANAPTQSECERELRDVLEGWILLGVAQHDETLSQKVSESDFYHALGFSDEEIVESRTRVAHLFPHP